jgi:radical SAM protein with 4Fe4S-binding SPASM domain
MKMKIITYLNRIGRANFLEHFKNNERLPSFKVKFKLLNRCNLKCKKCNYWRSNNAYAMDTSVIKEIIYQVSELGCYNIKFSGGEVLLREDLAEIIKYTKSTHIENVNLTTNGTLINARTARELIEAGLDQISISIDSPFELMHDELAGLKGAWERTLNAFRILKRESEHSEKELNIILQCVVSRDNLYALKDVVALANTLKVNGLSFLAYNSRYLGNKDSDLDVNEIMYFNEVFPRVIANAEALGMRITNPAYHVLKGEEMDEYYLNNSCYIPWINYYISAGGKVYACCASKEANFELGALNDTSLKEILRSEKYNTLREECKYPVKNKVCIACLNELNTNKLVRDWLRNYG